MQSVILAHACLALAVFASSGAHPLVDLGMVALRQESPAGPVSQALVDLEGTLQSASGARAASASVLDPVTAGAARLLATLRAELQHEDRSADPVERVRRLQIFVRAQRSLWDLPARDRASLSIRSATTASLRRIRLEQPALTEAIANAQARHAAALEALDQQYQELRSRVLVLSDRAPPSRRGEILREVRELARRVDQAVQAFARAVWGELTPMGQLEACRWGLRLLRRYRWVATHLSRPR